MNDIIKAKRFMYAKHKGQKYGQHPFTIHPMEVFSIIELLFPADTQLQCAALLHDVIENANTTYEELRKEFGAEVANLVDEVTKTAYNTFPNLETQRGVCLKFADRLSNLSHMEKWSKREQKLYIEKSIFWKL